MNSLLDVLLLLIAGGVFVVGFERYRRRFVKTDLVISLVIALGLVLLSILPSVYDQIAGMLDISNRYVIVSLLANLTLLTLILYFVGIVRSVREDISELTRSISIDEVPKTDGGAKSIFVIIPAYNEADSIRSVVQSLPETIRGMTVQPVVVSDGSADETATQAKYNGTIVVEHPINQGQGGSLQTGFQVAKEGNASIVVTMDGDGQHPAEDLEQLVSPIIDDEADFVMGSRYLGVDRSGNSTARQAGIRVFTKLINGLTKSDITDCTNGFRAIRGERLDDLTLTEERFNAPELIIGARKNGLRIKEVPITVQERQAGETKKPQLGYAYGLLKTIMTTWIR